MRFLFENILNYDKLDNFHLEIIESLNNKNYKQKLFLLPRGHWKSTLITIAYTIQRILQNPDISIFISNATLGNSKAFLREIKNQFEKNEQLRDLFGNQVGERWGEDEIIVSSRKSLHKEPTIRIGSVEHSVVSAHFDLLIFDDLCNRENTSTKEQCDKVVQYWKDCQALGIEDRTEFITVGTVWHHADLYSHIQVESKKRKDFSVIKKTCWKDELKTKPLFYKFTKEHLESLRQTMGSFDFAKQYENSVIDDSSAHFKRSWTQNTYNEEWIKQKPLHTFITIDAAMSTKDNSDYTGVIVSSVDAANNWYIRWVKRLKINTTELVNLIFDLWTNIEWKRSGLQAIGVEQKAFNDLIRPMLKTESESRNIFPIVKELKDLGRKKEDRIKGALQGRFEYGKVYFREAASDDTEWLKEELLKFPLSEHDDLSDALAYQQDIINAPHQDVLPKPRTKEEEEFYNYQKSVRNLLKRENVFNRI